MRSDLRGAWLIDQSPVILSRRAPTVLKFYWLRASVITGTLALASIAAFDFLGSGSVGVAPDIFQATVRLLAVLPLLVFCFVIVAFHRLVPYGITSSVVVLTSALSFWIVSEAAHQFHGRAGESTWFETGCMLVAMTAILMIAIYGVRFGQRAKRREVEAAEHDPLTGLLNRQGLLERCAQWASRSTATLIVFDLNQLKDVNDTHGHAIGDSHIRSVAHAIAYALPASSLLGRWGGDEFVAIVPASSDRRLPSIIHSALSRCPTLGSGFPAFAYGSAELSTGNPFERAFALADQRMYECKENQRATRVSDQYQLNALDGLTRQLELLTTPEELLTQGVPLVADLLHFDGAFYMERRQDVFAVTHMQSLSGHPLPLTIGMLHLPSRGIVGRAIREGRTAWNTDYPVDPDALPIWLDADLKTMIATPIRCDAEVVGVLGMCQFGTWKSVTPQIRRILETAALRIGHALDLQRVASEVHATLEGGLLGLGAALEARDLETGGHTRRVVDMATTLGRVLGLPQDQLDELRQGSYLHDIGKLVIPDAILLKPGKLDPEEWAIMQSHAVRGYEIATGIPTMSAGALRVIRSHHERWDGHGYPDGLRGDSISLLARIFTIVDVFDALTSKRPYKPAWSVQQAQAEMESSAGTQFDPALVRAFFSLPQLDTARATSEHLEPAPEGRETVRAMRIRP